MLRTVLNVTYAMMHPFILHFRYILQCYFFRTCFLTAKTCLDFGTTGVRCLFGVAVVPVADVDLVHV